LGQRVELLVHEGARRDDEIVDVGWDIGS